MTTPSKKSFLETTQKGKIPPIYKEIPYAPARPVYEPFAARNSFLLESVKGPPRIARYSFIGFDPCLVFKTRNGIIESPPVPKVPSDQNRPLHVLKTILSSYRQEPSAHLTPFQGGLVGLLGYDFVHYLEKLPGNASDDLCLPDSHFLLIDKLIAFDHMARKCWIIVSPGVGDSVAFGSFLAVTDWSEKYDEAESDIAEIAEKLSSVTPGHVGHEQ